MLEAILELPGVDINKPDNEGNTPLHFAAQAGKSLVWATSERFFSFLVFVC
jgi:ankyrin repeat protein